MLDYQGLRLIIATTSASTGAPPNTSPVAKPLLRGWFHLAAAVAALVYTVAACWSSWGDWPRLVSLLVFGLGMIELYTLSAIYHIGSWSPKVQRVLRSVDHSNIFVLIAATNTPLCFNLLTGWQPGALLTLLWLLVIAGIAVSVFGHQLPRWVTTALYIGMGWVGLLALPSFLQILPTTAILTLLVGGILYTLGAVVYALKRPNPFPGVLGFHEVFHLFTIAAGIAFASVVWVEIVPHGAG